MENKVYDFIGIGIGPFNLGLACLSEPLKEINSLFFEQKEGFEWHEDIMPEWSTLQIPFIADLVSFADPTSKFSFLNYLKDVGRLYQFYVRENFLILRSEYNNYCKWAVQQLNNLKFDHKVIAIEFDVLKQTYCIIGITSDGKKFEYETKKIVMGTGTSPELPHFCRNVDGCLHLGAKYKKHKEEYQQKKSITIIGSGQSGAEIYYDLLQDINKYGYQLNWVTASDRFFSMDTGKLSAEHYSPDYTNYFYSLSEHTRDELVKTQDILYKGINIKLVNEIYDLLYIKSQFPNFKNRIVANSKLINIKKNKNLFNLNFKQMQMGNEFNIKSEAVIIATGYNYNIPDFLSPIKDYLNWDSQKRLILFKNYSIDNNNTIFAQNVGLYTHGITVPDLGMGAYRNSIILKSILGREIYYIEKETTFQEFSPT